MDRLKEFGHILLYGQTNSGKTVLAKSIIDYLKPKNVYVFCPDRIKDWDSYRPNNIWDDKIIDEIIKTERKTFDLIIFDDFNTEINTITNKKYKDLFTNGRHSKIRVINLVHHSKAISPIATKNCRFCIIMSSLIDRDEYRALATLYSREHWTFIYKKAGEACNESKYNALILDKEKQKNEEIVIIKAPKPKEPIIEEIDDIEHQNINRIENRDQLINIPKESAMAQGDAIYTGLAQTGLTTNIGNRTNYGTDNSNNTYNTQLKANVAQLMETQLAQHNQKLIQMEYNRKEDLAARKYSCMNLIEGNKPLSATDKIYMLETFNMLLRPKKIFIMNDFQKAKSYFLKQYFPDYTETYREQKNYSILGTGMQLLTSENMTQQFVEGYNAIKLLTSDRIKSNN